MMNDTEPSAAPIIDIVSVSRIYKKRNKTIHSIEDVTLKVYPGEFIAITGASGSGKSTLLQMIGGLDKPTSGRVLINGTDLAKLSDKDLAHFRNQVIGFVFQFFYLQPFLKLIDNIAIPAMFASVKDEERLQRAHDLLDIVGLKDRALHYPHELSGGQIQRAAIARALINNPNIILADEPTGNLDDANSQDIIRLLRHMSRTYGTTVIIVTHDIAIASQADRKIQLYEGRLL